jgi:hypothetical protein
MNLRFRTRREDSVCGPIRTRRYGYRLRCLMPHGHDGDHRWTAELVDAAGR